MSEPTDAAMTQSERRTYQSLRARGFSHEAALSDALDGVDVHDVRRALATEGAGA